MAKKKVSIEEFSNLINSYKKIGKKEVILKTDVVSDLLNKSLEDDMKIKKLIAEKYILILELHKKGLSYEDIGKFLGKENK